MPNFPSSQALLERLVKFPTVSRETNLPLIDWIEDYLRERGFACHRIKDASGQKAGLFAALGPSDVGGIMLSAHSDVVPAAGQEWNGDPFRLRECSGRLYGRGASDMKGFLACALRLADRSARRKLGEPLKLAVSWDEEIGCVGIAEMIGELDNTVGKPELCIVGEPTGMGLVIGHKGKTSHRVVFRGSGGHSSLAPRYLNALHMAADYLAEIRIQQDLLISSGLRDIAYKVPVSTLHVGRLSGGTALNIVPDSASLDFEFRSIAQDSQEPVLFALEKKAERIVSEAKEVFSGAAVECELLASYPALETDADGPGVARMLKLLERNETLKVSFGTEAGVFASAGIESVVCGPGSIDVAHKADEFIEIEQLNACDKFLDRLLDTMAKV